MSDDSQAIKDGRTNKKKKVKLIQGVFYDGKKYFSFHAIYQNGCKVYNISDFYYI